MLEVIILAAGQGSRMQSRLPKVLHLLSGRPLIHYTLDAARAAGANHIHVVVGCGADAVEAAVQAPDVQCHLQAQQKGTGHAVQQAIGACHPDSTLLVLFGDVPLVSDTTLQAVVAAAESGIAMLSAEVEDPSGYGRVVRDDQGDFLAVVEHKDASQPNTSCARLILACWQAEPACSRIGSLGSRITTRNQNITYRMF